MEEFVCVIVGSSHSFSLSDHIAILVKGSADLGPTGKSSRRYELFLERDPMLPDIIREAWEAVGGVQNLAQLRDALSKTMSLLGVWSKKN